MNITTIPPFTPPAEFAGASNPFLELSERIGKVYAESLQANVHQLWMSSARIIQEHTMSALMNATQGCIEALAQNAAASQEQALARLVNANRRAFEIMTSAVTAAMTPGFKPA